MYTCMYVPIGTRGTDVHCKPRHGVQWVLRLCLSACKHVSHVACAVFPRGASNCCPHDCSVTLSGRESPHSLPVGLMGKRKSMETTPKSASAAAPKPTAPRAGAVTAAAAPAGAAAGAQVPPAQHQLFNFGNFSNRTDRRLVKSTGSSLLEVKIYIVGDHLAIAIPGYGANSFVKTLGDGIALLKTEPYLPRMPISMPLASPFRDCL
jgi:hypothetical protein